MKGLERSFLILVLVLLVSACSNPLDSSSTDGVDFTPQALGMDYCYDCHNIPGSSQAFEQVFEGWVVSRHSNFDYYDSVSESGTPVDPFNLGAYTYSDIEGNPSYYANTSVYPTCLLYTSPSPRDRQRSRMPSSA